VLAVAFGVGAAQAQSSEDPGSTVTRFLSQQRVTAWLRADYYQSSNNLDGEKNFFGGTLQAKALPRLSELVDGKIEARLATPDVSDRRGYGIGTELLEGYATLHLKRVDLRLGKQIVAWGRADGINPTDNLTPRNYRVMLPLEEDQRFGTWGARLDAYLSQALTLEIFASTFFEPAQFPLPPVGAAVSTQRPGHSAHNGELGIKLNKTSGGFDWSLSYYSGYSLLPVIGFATSALQLHYDRVQVVGADCARNYGRFGFRSEVAYTLPQDHPSADPNAVRPRLFWVNGVDRTFFENLNVNAQVFVRWMPRYQNPADQPDLMARVAGELNAIIGGQEAGASPGVTFRVSDQWLNNTLQAELLSLINLRRGDHYLRPLVTYDVSDRTRVLFGANLYGGPRDAPYGLQRSDNGVFTEIRYAL
jgi:hypothetical protein